MSAVLSVPRPSGAPTPGGGLNRPSGPGPWPAVVRAGWPVPRPTLAPPPAAPRRPAPSPVPAPLSPIVALANSLDAARAAGFSPRGPDDLTLVEGIGPRIAALLRAAGITGYAALAATAPAQIQARLDAAGPHFRLARPETWPEQAALAARGQWEALARLQHELIGGRRA